MKKRIIPSILLRGGTQVCLSQGFSPWRSVGALAQSLRLHVQRSADELLIINLDQAGRHQFVLPDRILRLVRQEVDIPISYAGGIRSASDASFCINEGFDKIYLTAAFIDEPSVLQSIADVVGSQSLGLVLPYKRKLENGQAMIWDYRSKSISDLGLLAAMEASIAFGVGEILLHDVSRDGSLAGFDPLVVSDVSMIQPPIPILLAGGAANGDQIAQVLQSSWIQGIVAGSIFSLTSETPVTIRKQCEDRDIPMRRCGSRALHA